MSKKEQLKDMLFYELTKDNPLVQDGAVVDTTELDELVDKILEITND